MNPDGVQIRRILQTPSLLDKDLKEVHDGVLGDIVPTILELMGIEKPTVMTQHSLL
jgi:2,3-bisphosphoglycerate-independent phosphoglycerate mutase